MTHEPPRVVAVTLNWNGADDTLACVRALRSSQPAPTQIIVCDNASKPESWQQLMVLAGEAGDDFASFASLSAALHHPTRPSLVLIQTGANLGYAGGINVGLRYALADAEMDYAWVLNNDTEVDARALAALLKRMAAEPNIGICGATLLLHHDREKVQALGGASYTKWRARSAALGIGLARSLVPVDPVVIEPQLAYVNGAAMLVRRAYLEHVGLMDERYFLYSEEHDWAYRGRDRFRLGWAPDAWVFHKHGATIGTASSGGSPLSLFYLFRSKLLFAMRHHPTTVPVAGISLVVDALKFAAKGHPRKAWAALKGLCAAIIPGLAVPK